MHSPEPWKVSIDREGVPFIVDANECVVADWDLDRQYPASDAHRIVACVNLLTGVLQEVLDMIERQDKRHVGWTIQQEIREHISAWVKHNPQWQCDEE